MYVPNFYALPTHSFVPPAPQKDWIILAWQLKQKKAVKDKPLTAFAFVNI